MNLSQINHQQIFFKDFNQIKEKRRILRVIPNLNLISEHIKEIDLKPVVDWFNDNLKKRYKNLGEIAYNIPEDICIVKKINNQYIMVALVVAFLNRWRTTEKIGKNLFMIHEPIPESEKLVKKISGFFDLIDEDLPYRRSNWGLTATDELYLPYDKSDGLNRIYLRTETQTIIKVGEFIIFLIKTDLRLIEKKEKIYKYTQGLNKEMIEYKQLQSKM